MRDIQGLIGAMNLATALGLGCIMFLEQDPLGVAYVVLAIANLLIGTYNVCRALGRIKHGAT